MTVKFRVFYILNNKKYVADCGTSAGIATSLAKRKVKDGATDVIITVTPTEGEEEDPECIEVFPIEN